jgi:copper chaperone CopZ
MCYIKNKRFRMKKLVLSIVALATLACADQMTKLSITGMTCGGCVGGIKSSIWGVAGVSSTTVYLKEGRAEVTAKEGTKPEAMCDAVKKAGYGCKVVK